MIQYVSVKVSNDDFEAHGNGDAAYKVVEFHDNIYLHDDAGLICHLKVEFLQRLLEQMNVKCYEFSVAGKIT